MSARRQRQTATGVIEERHAWGPAPGLCATCAPGFQPLCHRLSLSPPPFKTWHPPRLRGFKPPFKNTHRPSSHISRWGTTPQEKTAPSACTTLTLGRLLLFKRWSIRPFHGCNGVNTPSSLGWIQVRFRSEQDQPTMRTKAPIHGSEVNLTAHAVVIAVIPTPGTRR